ncbi:MAG TPA: hypothetical protein VEA99_20070 [Gemmatimonadaceae bacterium]|nr:hypothetical protein [Gemmatimonadaceae bacterium]
MRLNRLVPALLVIAAPIPAQVQQQAMTLQLQPYTQDQLWTRSRNQTIAMLAGGIARAKARGVSVDAYAHELAALFSPTWGPRDAGTPMRVFRSVMLNELAAAGTTVEPVIMTDTAVTFRVTRQIASFFGPRKTFLGVSLEEYERAHEIFMEDVAVYLGLRYESRVEGDCRIMTIRGKGARAVTRIPPGTYRTTIPAAQAGSRTDVVGEWRATFQPDGQFVVAFAGNEVVRGRFDQHLDQIRLHSETGSHACTLGVSDYRWTRNADTGAITFVLLADGCAERPLVVQRTWTPVP